MPQEYAKVEILTHFDSDKSDKINLPEFKKGCTKWLEKWKNVANNSDVVSKNLWEQASETYSVLIQSSTLNSVDLIQDLRFETATTRIKATPDGEFLIASGIYPPQVKVYELRELSLKFERHLISEIINFQVLSDDYSKLAFLCADCSVCLHAKYGSHYSLRIPRYLNFSFTAFFYENNC
ncbi:hypothetical protein L1887_07029 [Cichorium endivia]|nr:hypothetical protein L1887_07029 [Cichorium endivia]